MVATPVNKEDYYCLRFKGIEWQYILTKIMSTIKIETWNDYYIGSAEDNGDYIYMLKKERYPAETIAKALGIGTELITQREVLILDDPTENKDLPKPTVPGWGTA